MTIGIYLIKTVLISGLLFGYFWFFLRNRKFHRFNRLFLMNIPVLSLLLPALHFHLPGFLNGAANGKPIHLLGVGQGRLEEAVTIYTNRNLGNIFPWQLMATMIMLCIIGFLFIRFIKTVRFLIGLRKDKPMMNLKEATLYFVSEKGTPFSFFKSIFWGEETEINCRAGHQMLLHELLHIRNNHSREIITMEIMSILFWFNPFMHLIKRELKLTHEYEADAYVLSETDEFEYAILLITKISGSPLPLTNPFFKNQIKKRIAMITKSKKIRNSILCRLMILPLIAGLICLFSFSPVKHQIFNTEKPLRVVVDPGHGGMFTGASLNGVYEKNINLAIAKKIQALSGEYHIDVIMSRESDITPGSSELRKSLEYIAALPKNKKADLFISIHTNSTESGEKGKTQTDKSGFQIYIPRNTSEMYDGSLKFGSVMTELIKPDYSIEPELKQTQGDGTNILILKKATVPALLIECGYMDNPSDLKYLLDEKNQEKIARDILEGIKKYGTEKTFFSKFDNTPDTTRDYPMISREEAERIPLDDIQGIDVDKKKYLILINTKDGSKYAYDMPEEIKKSIDNPKEAAKQLQEIENALDSMNQANPKSHIVYSQVENNAQFPGGENAWRAYMIKNLNYPVVAQKKELQGQVIIAFVVKKDGSLTDIHALSGPAELRPASVEVIKKSGKWIPATNNGFVVESYRKQPIIYKLAAQ